MYTIRLEELEHKMQTNPEKSRLYVTHCENLRARILIYSFLVNIFYASCLEHTADNYISLN
jgi:hypothetical protein